VKYVFLEAETCTLFSESTYRFVSKMRNIVFL